MIVSLLYYESLKSGIKCCYEYVKRFMYEKKGRYKARKIKEELIELKKKEKEELIESSEEKEEELYLE